MQCKTKRNDDNNDSGDRCKTLKSTTHYRQTKLATCFHSNHTATLLTLDKEVVDSVLDTDLKTRTKYQKGRKKNILSPTHINIGEEDSEPQYHSDIQTLSCDSNRYTHEEKWTRVKELLRKNNICTNNNTKGNINDKQCVRSRNGTMATRAKTPLKKRTNQKYNGGRRKRTKISNTQRKEEEEEEEKKQTQQNAVVKLTPKTEIQHNTRQNQIAAVMRARRESRRSLLTSDNDLYYEYEQRAMNGNDIALEQCRNHLMDCKSNFLRSTHKNGADALGNIFNVWDFYDIRHNTIQHCGNEDIRARLIPFWIQYDLSSPFQVFRAYLCARNKQRNDHYFDTLYTETQTYHKEDELFLNERIRQKSKRDEKRIQESSSSSSRQLSLQYCQCGCTLPLNYIRSEWMSMNHSACNKRVDMLLAGHYAEEFSVFKTSSLPLVDDQEHFAKIQKDKTLLESDQNFYLYIYENIRMLQFEIESERSGTPLWYYHDEEDKYCLVNYTTIASRNTIDPISETYRYTHSRKTNIPVGRDEKRKQRRLLFTQSSSSHRNTPHNYSKNSVEPLQYSLSGTENMSNQNYNQDLDFDLSITSDMESPVLSRRDTAKSDTFSPTQTYNRDIVNFFSNDGDVVNTTLVDDNNNITHQNDNTLSNSNNLDMLFSSTHHHSDDNNNNNNDISGEENSNNNSNNNTADVIAAVLLEDDTIDHLVPTDVHMENNPSLNIYESTETLEQSVNMNNNAISDGLYHTSLPYTFNQISNSGDFAFKYMNSDNPRKDSGGGGDDDDDNSNINGVGHMSYFDASEIISPIDTYNYVEVNSFGSNEHKSFRNMTCDEMETFIISNIHVDTLNAMCPRLLKIIGVDTIKSRANWKRFCDRNGILGTEPDAKGMILKDELSPTNLTRGLGMCKSKRDRNSFIARTKFDEMDFWRKTDDLGFPFIYLVCEWMDKDTDWDFDSHHDNAMYDENTVKSKRKTTTNNVNKFRLSLRKDLVSCLYPNMFQTFEHNFLTMKNKKRRNMTSKHDQKSQKK